MTSWTDTRNRYLDAVMRNPDRAAWPWLGDEEIRIVDRIVADVRAATEARDRDMVRWPWLHWKYVLPRWIHR